MKLAVAAVFLAMAANATAVAQTTQQQLAREARAAYDKADYATFLAKTQAASKLSPGDVWVLYNVACGQAITGKRAEAVKTLDTLVKRRVRFDLEAENDFASLRDGADFGRFLKGVVPEAEQREVVVLKVADR